MITNSSNRMCIYVSSPKSCKDVFDAFVKCKNKYWDTSNYPLILSTNYEANYDGIYVINSNKMDDTWVERSLSALASIHEKYVMLLCDDIFISKSINNNYIESILDFMDKNNIQFCRLKPLKNGKRISGIGFLSWVAKDTPYGINLQRGIYNRQFLINLLGDGTKTAWDIEAELLRRASLEDNEIFEDIIACNKNIFPVVHGVDKGKWLPSAISFLKREKIHIELERPVLSRRQELIQNIKSSISNKLHPNLRKKLKDVLLKVGIKFTSKY